MSDSDLTAAFTRQAFRSGAVQEARQFLLLTQADLAAMCGVSTSAVSRWEAGHRTPSRSATERVGRGLAQLFRDCAEVEDAVEHVAGRS